MINKRYLFEKLIQAAADEYTEYIHGSDHPVDEAVVHLIVSNAFNKLAADVKKDITGV